MATATETRAYPADIRLEYGVAQLLCFASIEGRDAREPSKYPPFLPRTVFKTVDGRSLWLDAEDAADLSRGMRELNVSPSNGDFVRVTKIRHAHGGGHSIRVERDGEPAKPLPAYETAKAERPAPNAPGESLTERQLRASLAEIEARKREKAAAETAAAQVQTIASTAKEKGSNGLHPARSTSHGPITTTHARFLAAYMVAIDVLTEAKVYALRKGLTIEPRCEDCRALAATIMINGNGGRA